MDDKVIVAAIFAAVIVIALLLFRMRVKATLSGPFKSKLTLDARNPDPQMPGALLEDATSLSMDGIRARLSISSPSPGPIHGTAASLKTKTIQWRIR